MSLDNTDNPVIDSSAVTLPKISLNHEGESMRESLGVGDAEIDLACNIVMAYHTTEMKKSECMEQILNNDALSLHGKIGALFTLGASIGEARGRKKKGADDDEQ